MISYWPTHRRWVFPHVLNVETTVHKMNSLVKIQLKALMTVSVTCNWCESKNYCKSPLNIWGNRYYPTVATQKLHSCSLREIAIKSILKSNQTSVHTVRRVVVSASLREMKKQTQENTHWRETVTLHCSRTIKITKLNTQGKQVRDTVLPKQNCNV